MAILNVKAFPDDLHRALKERAAREHRSVSQEVIHLLSQALRDESQLSILDLRGLGKSPWKGIEPSEHIDRERQSWE